MGPVLQIPRQFPKPTLKPTQFDLRERLPVSPGRAAIAADPGPGLHQEIHPPDLVDQGAKVIVIIQRS